MKTTMSEFAHFTESVIEQAALVWLETLGYEVVYGPLISPEEPGKPGIERETYEDVILPRRLQAAVGRINPTIPTLGQEEALHSITRLGKPSLLLNNHAFHALLVNGIEVDYKNKDGHMVSGRVYAVDFENPENNDWLVVNQYTVEASHQNGTVNRRPDVVIFVNGLPLAVIQSTQDGYLPAAQAQQLFGPDGERRRFYSIRAGNHTFAGARSALYEQARVALEWIEAKGRDGIPRASSVGGGE
jgi:type I site-specific restriction-modification system R (restriction) subunit